MCEREICVKLVNQSAAAGLALGETQKGLLGLVCKKKKRKTQKCMAPPKKTHTHTQNNNKTKLHQPVNRVSNDWKHGTMLMPIKTYS